MSHFILPEKTRQSCWILKLPIFTPRIQSEENEAAADEDEDDEEEEEEEEEEDGEGCGGGGGGAGEGGAERVTTGSQR